MTAHPPTTTSRETTMPARRTTTPARVPADAHVPHERAGTPGVCAHCPLPVDARNARHITDPTDTPPAPDDARSRAAGDRTDTR
jgi:hypothetical protein